MPRGAAPAAGAKPAAPAGGGALSSALDSVKQGIGQTANALAQGTKVGLGVWKDTAQGLGKIPFQIGASLADVPRTIAGQQPLKPFNVPGLGSVSSYPRQAVDIQNDPKSIFYNKPGLSALYAGSKGVLDTALAGGLAKSIVNEPGGFNYDPSKGSYQDVAQTGRRNASGGLNLLDNSAPAKAPGGFDPSQTLYRGEGAGNTGGLHFSTDQAWAKNFGNNMIQGNLPPGAKVYQLQPQDMEQAFQKGITNEGDLWKSIFDKGYDAIQGVDSMNSKAADIIVNPAIRGSFGASAQSMGSGIPSGLLPKAAGVAPLGAALGERLSPQKNARQKTATSTQSSYGR